MVENLLVMMALCLILVGLLQIFHLAVARFLTRYSAFCTARSAGVGFADYLLQRSARVAAIGASGRLIYPDNTSFWSLGSQFQSERMYIPDYLSGKRWLEYEYWLGENSYDSRYYARVPPPCTTLRWSNQPIGQMNETTITFRGYPFVFLDLLDPGRVWFEQFGYGFDLSGNARVANHAADYLQ